MTSLTFENGALVVNTRYDAGFVAALKSQIPSTERKFDPARRVWIADPRHAGLVATLIQQYLGEMVFTPQIIVSAPKPETRILEVRYLGQTKDRGTGERSAFGLDAAGQWSVIIPESVLRQYFCDGSTKPGQTATLYALLGIQTAALPDEVKTAYRRMAKQWHPDVCKEPDAASQFLRIQEAYNLLSNPGKRARYDAGLVFEASLGHAAPARFDVSAAYRSPLRCGLILAEGTESIGRFTVSKITLWEDITNPRGQVLVTSWPMGATKPVETWA